MSSKLCALTFKVAVFICYILLCSRAYGGCSKPPATTESPHLWHASGEPPINATTLELVHVVMRHGPRTPVTTYPNDPYINHTFWPFGWGQLTNDGKQEVYQMGGWLQQRYSSLLSSFYRSDVLHAQSTASPRTMMTLALVLAALYPPQNTPMAWSNDINWQPIPIYTEPLATDALLRMQVPCPRYDEALKEVYELPEIVTEMQQYHELYTNLTHLTGMNITKPDDINSLYITFLTETNFGLDLPYWARWYYPEQMEYLAAQHYMYDAYTDEMKKLKAGPFLAKWLGDLQAQVAGTLMPSDRKMFIYCGHDWTITNILAALNVWQPEVPNFSYVIALELHRNPATNERYVEIHVKDDVAAESRQLVVPGCAAQCPLSELMALCAKVLPDDTYDQMCASRSL